MQVRTTMYPLVLLLAAVAVPGATGCAPESEMPGSGEAADSGKADAPWPAGGEPYAVELDRTGIRIDGRYRLLRGGSVQWFRIPPEDWDARLARIRAAGFNIVDIYIPWNVVEPEEGVFDFQHPDLRRFLQLCEEHHLFVAVRPGPFITNEMDGGGLPAWLTRRASKQSYDADGRVNIRTHDPDFIEPVRRYFHALDEVLEPYFATRGGPIVLYAIENEYTWFKRFFDIDKLFWHDGGSERPLGQEFLPAPYMMALRDIVLESGVDIPIVTCPGDAQVSATGDVPGVIPFPNFYEWATPKQPEQAAHDLLVDMHDPQRHNGVYTDVPSGSLEVARSPQLFRRLFMGGLDALFGFNMAGMIQEGRLNSLTLASRALDEPPHWGPPGQPQSPWLDTIFDVSLDNILNGFVSPRFGYFHNVLDYEGALGPSGLPRKIYYQFRRDNLFFDSVEAAFAAAGHPVRSGAFDGADTTLTIQHPELGTRETSERRVHYWLDGGEGGVFIGVLNQSGRAQTVDVGGVRFRDASFPRFVPMTAPLAEEPNNVYVKILVFGLPIGGGARIAYSTSELLTSRDYNGDRLLVLYDVAGADGELALAGLTGPVEVLHRDPTFEVRESTGQALTVTYRHEALAQLLIRDGDGERVRVLVTTRELAGHFWFLSGEHDVVVIGADHVDGVVWQGNHFSFAYDWSSRPRALTVLAPFEFDLAGSSPIRPHDPVTQTATYPAPPSTTLPPLTVDLRQGRSLSDHAEASPDYDDGDWTAWQGQPKELEALDIYRGHAWYRAELTLNEALSWLNRGRLYVEHASDIVGIYVNGHYLATVSPVGTEIDSHHGRNRDYQFESAKPHLQLGRNVVAFRTEIWGHGSFMFPKGTLSGTTMQLPGVGYEGMKGLYGEATLAGLPLERWSVRAGLGGDLGDHWRTTFDDSGWDVATIPLQLDKGDVRWYRTEFRTVELPDPAQLIAPVAVELKGRRTKATIYVNDRLIGRWLSDTEWLVHGTWGQPTRGMWINNDPDLFPVPQGILRADGQPNVIAIAFEDTSHDTESAGSVDVLRLRYNDERYDWEDDGYVRGPAFSARGRAELTIR